MRIVNDSYRDALGIVAILEAYDPWPRIMEGREVSCPQFAPHDAHPCDGYWCPGVKEPLTNA
jgi:hypothetical protein